MNNPLLYNKFSLFSFFAVVLVTSALYSFITGSLISLPPYFIITDAIITAVLLSFSALFLWNVLIYGPPRGSGVGYRVIYKAALSLLFTGLIIGTLSLITYYYFHPLWHLFTKSIILRSAFLTLFYIIILLYYNGELLTIEYNNEIENLYNEEKENKPSDNKCEVITRLTVNFNGTIKVIPIEEILCLKANGDYVEVVTTQGSWLKEQTMKSLEQTLPQDQFARIHRSFIVNISSITRIERYGEKKMVLLKNGERIKTSATGDKVLKEKLNL